MAINYLGDNNPDGSVLGTSSTELIGFHGATPSDQYANIATVSTTIMSTTSGTIFGFTSSDAGLAVISAVNNILALLEEKGLMSS